MEKKVLLIEDSVVDAAVVENILSVNGFTVQIAKNAKEGYDKAARLNPDLILLDLILPDGSGFDLCRRLRDKFGEKVLIVILSIKNELHDITKAFECGADDYVVKPPAPEILLKKIQLYLRGK